MRLHVLVLAALVATPAWAGNYAETFGGLPGRDTGIRDGSVEGGPSIFSWEFWGNPRGTINGRTPYYNVGVSPEDQQSDTSRVGAAVRAGEAIGQPRGGYNSVTGGMYGSV